MKFVKAVQTEWLNNVKAIITFQLNQGGITFDQAINYSRMEVNKKIPRKT